MEYEKDHDGWNKLKKILDWINIPVPFHEGEIWWIAQGVNVGIEIDGKGDDFQRPALIIKKHNKHHAWIVPLTSTKILKSGIHISINYGNFNSYSAAIITQFQTISDKRLLSKMGVISNEQLREIIIAIKNIFPKI